MHNIPLKGNIPGVFRYKNYMKILAINTTHGTCSLAIAENNQIIAEITDNEPAKQAERLFAHIEDLLAKSGLKYSDINAVAADIGPGSFTGVRIGLAAARGIALAAKIPLIGVTGFEAISADLRHHNYSQNLLIVLDARRGSVFAQFIGANSKSKESMLDYKDIAMVIDGKEQVMLVGSGIKYVEEYLENYEITDGYDYSDAKMVALGAYEKLQSENYDSKSNVSPLYIRPPDAKLSQKSTLFT